MRAVPGVKVKVKAIPAAAAGAGMLEWSGAAVETGGGKPTTTAWEAVDVPGRPAEFAGEDRVAYRTTFPDPRDPGDDLACVRLRGLYDGGTVWLDGELVAETDTVFEPVRVPFDPAAENELVVTCRAPDDRYGGVHDTDRIPDSRSVPGVWWGAEVTTHPATFVVDVDVAPLVTDDGAAIETAVEVFSRDGVDDRLTLTTRPAGKHRGRGVMDRASVEAAPGERTTARHTIELRDPSLWWPRGLGPQHRYEVRAKLDDHVVTATTGLVTVAETDDGLAVNGESVPVRGVTLQDGAVADVDRAVEVNANLVRAHAHVLPPAVYEACDEAGLLVWQDLPLTGEGVFDIGRGQELAGRMAATHDGHPSLAAFAVHDEPTTLFAERVGSGLVDRLRLRWRVWRSDYDRAPAERVAEEFPDDRPVYPVVGEPGTDPDAAALYPGWDYGTVDDVAWLRDRYGLGEVVGEFGAGSLATDDPGETPGFDRAKHDAVVDGDGVDASQTYQADLLRTVAERLRADGAGVVVADALRDTGDAGSGVYDRNGDPKRAAEALATAFEPVRAILTEPGPGDTDVVVVNDTGERVEGTLRWTAGDEGGELDVTVEHAGRTVAGRLDVPDDADGVTLDLTVADRSVQTEHRF
jgi:beta-mannosidase